MNMLGMIKMQIKNSSAFGMVLGIYKRYFQTRRGRLGYIHPTAFFRYPILVKGAENVFLHERTSILGEAKILATRAKFVMKRNSGAAEGLTVVTGDHYHPVGKFHRFVTDNDKPNNLDKDVIIEEDVLVSTNVTLLAGVTVGRGCIVGSGAVVRNSTPPYSIVVGNPAKVIGFKFTPEEIIEHEKALYAEGERLPFAVLQKNYDKYYRRRIKDIINYIKQ